MAQSTSYPSPDVAHEGIHPFFSQQMPAPDNAHISHRPAANMQGGVNDRQDYGQLNHNGQGYGNVSQHEQLNHSGQVYGQASQNDSLRHLSTPQQLAQRGLDADQSEDHHDSESSARKRSKVSRACDDCRRKKIRCDAESEVPGVQCSSCRRSGGTCAFSRKPQKRGPSKGYIKELLERVINLESQTGPDLLYSTVVQEHPGTHTSPLDYTRKRSHGLIEMQHNFEQNHQELQPFAARHQDTSSEITSTEVQRSNVLHQPLDAHLVSRNTHSTTLSFEKMVEDYYDLIHPYLPLLHESKSLLLQAAFIPVHLRNALFAALEAAITSCISPGYHDALERAIDLLKPLQAARLRSRTSRENITYVQALILMSMATQSSGSMHIRETTWFDQALSIAWYMRLHQSHLYNDAHDDVPDPELDHGRRIWLTLVLLDRWSAISTAGPLKIADNYAKLVPSDHALIGSSSYHLVRISLTMSIISDNYTCNPELVDSDAPNIVLSHFAVTAINRLDESLQHLQELPHVRLAFCHLKLLSNRLVSGYQSNTNEIVEGALSIVNQLQAPNTSSAPFGHHIAALAAITLAESLKLPSHTSKALDGLQSLQTTLSASRLTFYPFTADKTVWNTSILAYITKKVEEHAASTSQTLNNDVDMPAGTRGGLQHLADAAVGNSNDNDGNNAQDGGHLVPVDFTKAGRKGYLTFFE